MNKYVVCITLVTTIKDSLNLTLQCTGWMISHKAFVLDFGFVIVLKAID